MQLTGLIHIQNPLHRFPYRVFDVIHFVFSRVDWVEIREPRSGDLMYANVRTGECLWEAPSSAKV